MLLRILSSSTTKTILTQSSSRKRILISTSTSSKFNSTPLTIQPFSTSTTQSILEPDNKDALPRAEHAVISTFDLFSIGVGPSSSHTLGPMRAGKIFITDLTDMGLLQKIVTLKITLYGSLAATGKGHMTPQAIMMGLEGSDAETIETSTVNSRYDAIVATQRLQLGGTTSIKYDMDKDMLWRIEPLPTHPNGMRFSAFDVNGDLLATNEYFSVGGGFVVNERTQVDENLYYRSINKEDISPARRDQTHGILTLGLPAPDQSGERSQEKMRGNEKKKEVEEKPQPPFLFRNAQGLLVMTQKYNLTIAQLVWNNELSYMTSEEISANILKIWGVMDQSIHEGVTSKEEVLPGRLMVRRRAAGLYRRLFKGFYSALPPPASFLPSPTSPELLESSTSKSLSIKDGFSSQPPSAAYVKVKTDNPRKGPPLVVGSFEHDLPVVPWKSHAFPGIDFLSCYAIAVNEVNAAGGRIVTAPTNGAAGVIPSVLKYFIEFISDDPDRDIKTFLLTAAAVGMLYKRGATISAAEGGCMAEVGVASSMAAAGFAACMGGTPSQILQAAEIGIEHSLGLTCDPIDGLVQVPCIERNSLGAVKAVTAAQLALAGDGIHSVSLDEAIDAMRVTARDMHNNYKETSMAGLAKAVQIPLSSPAC